MTDKNEKMFALVIEGDGNLYVKIHRTEEGCIASARKDWDENISASCKEGTDWSMVEKCLRDDGHFIHEGSNTVYSIAKDCPVCD